MTPRKKLGIGSIFSGAVAVVTGIVYVVLPSDPAWLGVLSAIMAALAGVFGLSASAVK